MVKSSNPNLHKLISLTAYIAIAGAFAFLLADRHPPTLAVGTSAPIDEKIELLNGHLTTVRKMLKKPMIINFWASFCAPCIKELPVLSKVASAYQGQVIVLGTAVATDLNDVLALKSKYFLEYHHARVADAVVDKWQARALPTTYLIDRDGIIRWAKTGISTEEELKQAISLIVLKKHP